MTMRENQKNPENQVNHDFDNNPPPTNEKFPKHIPPFPVILYPPVPVNLFIKKADDLNIQFVLSYKFRIAAVFILRVIC